MAQEIANSTLLDTWGSGGNIVEPDISKIIEGWQLGEQPPHEYMNWLQNTFGSKLNHILKNGGVKWNNETEYLAGSSVQHNGNVWLCKTTNTNSEPADVNANWKRIITVESLPDTSNGYVALTGNQTIAGVKTFSSTISGSISGNAGTATKLATARTIGGVSFDGSANINLPGVNTAGNQNTTGNAATVTNGVYTTGDQTIAGIKTFSSSPIVPTPTAGDNSTKVATTAFVKTASATASGVGVGQTWQNVTSSRSAGVTYTNSTGKPIVVVGMSLTAITTIEASLEVDGIVVATSYEYSEISGGMTVWLSAIVPNGSTYKFNSADNRINAFRELR